MAFVSADEQFSPRLRGLGPAGSARTARRRRSANGSTRLATAVAASLALGGCVTQVPAASVGVTGAPARDEYQIAWMIAPVSAEPNVIVANPNEVILRAPLLPERLYAATQPVRGREGATLLAQGMQLVLMDYPNFLVCSQARGVRGTTAASNRVCLLDETGDRVPDSYFLRSFGRSALTSDGMWFAMNQRMTANRLPLAPAVLAEIDPAALTEKPELAIRFGRMADSSRSMRLSGAVNGIGSFGAECPAYLNEANRSGNNEFCVVPPIGLRPLARAGEQVHFAMVGAARPAKVRFDARYGIVGHEITRVRIFFADAAKATSMGGSR